MRKTWSTPASLVCGMMLLALAACDGNSPSEPGGGQMRLAVALSSNSVAAGEAVDITFTALNAGGSPVQLTFGDSCKADFSVASGGVVVWNLRASAFCLQEVKTDTVNPGASYTFRMNWDQSKNGGGRVGPGTYTVYGTLMSDQRPTSPPVTLTVR